MHYHHRCCLAKGGERRGFKTHHPTRRPFPRIWENEFIILDFSQKTTVANLSIAMASPNWTQNVELYARMMLGLGVVMFPFLLPLLYSRLFTGKANEGLSNEEVSQRELQGDSTGCCGISSSTGLFISEQTISWPGDQIQDLEGPMFAVLQSAIYRHTARSLHPGSIPDATQSTIYMSQTAMVNLTDPSEIQYQTWTWIEM